ncbi:MAG: hypothetical protein HKN34_02765 [Gammaproteobacteria bacterium]|nr:hypothetical protein [Gammaproteobacteria bacterium]
MNTNSVNNNIFLIILLLLFAMSVMPAMAGAESDCDYSSTPAALNIQRHNVFNHFKSVYFSFESLDDREKMAYENSLERHLGRFQYSPEQLQPHEKYCLELAYSRGAIAVESDFAALGMSDYDQDGKRDFLIGMYGGLIENDTDVDNDCIPNYADLEPFDKYQGNSEESCDGTLFADDDSDGIPNHIDWSQTRDTSNLDLDLPKIQACLFGGSECDDLNSGRKIQVLLIDKEKPLTDETIKTLRDVLVRIIANCRIDGLEFCQKKGYSKLALDKIYGSDNPFLQSDEGEPKSGRRGEVLLGNRAMYLYGLNNDSHLGGEDKIKHLLRFLSISHELMHAIQYSFDYPENLRQVESSNRYITPKFIRYVNRRFKAMGIYAKKQDPESEYTNVLFNELGTFPYAASVFHTDFEDLDYDDGFENLSGAGDEKYKRYSFIRGYEFSDIFEWHAVQIEAYLLNSMVDYYAKNIVVGDQIVAKDKVKRIRRAFHCLRKGVYYEHASSEVMQVFKQEFPISDSDLDYLTREYLLSTGIQNTNLDGGCG